VKKLLVSALFVCLLSIGIFADEVVDKTLAIVNGEPLMSSEFDRIIEPILSQQKAIMPLSEQTEDKINDLKNKVLDEKISQMLLAQEAKKQKIKVPKRELDAAVDQIKKRFPNEETFKEEMKKEGLSQVEFDKRIEEQMMSMKLIEKEVKNKVKPPTEDEIKSFYNQVMRKMKGENLNLPKEKEMAISTVAMYLKRMSSEQVKVRQIFIKCDKSANAEEKKAALNRVNIVKKELEKGGNFADLSAKYSEDKALRERKGDMGFVIKGDLTKPLEDAVFSMMVGKYTKEPVKTDYGYHFLRVEGINASQSFTYDDIKNELAEVVYQQKSKDAYDAWVNTLKSKANIKINQVW